MVRLHGATSVELLRQQKHGVHGTKRTSEGTPSTETLGAINGIANGVGDSRPRNVQSRLGKRITASKICECIKEQAKDSEKQDHRSNVGISGIPSSSLNPLLRLSHPCYGLSHDLVRNLESLGIQSIYPWQSSCLLGRGVLSGEENLIYTAPTGGGKSLIADVLVLKRVSECPFKKAILVLPYVALVQEKVKWLRKAVDGIGRKVLKSSQVDFEGSNRRKDSSIRVEGFFGGSRSRASWSDVDIAVCTFEKGNSLVNTAIEEGTIDDLVAVILDELHMIDDDHRGYLMELLATKLLLLERQVQIIGMSATLPNTQLLARWLNAKYYETRFKPIQVKEYLVLDNAIYSIATLNESLKGASQVETCQAPSPASSCRRIMPSDHAALRNPVRNAVLSLAVETASSGFSALVFCSGRQVCQDVADLISTAMPDPHGQMLDRRQSAINELRNLSVALDDALAKILLSGVAFYHAGLTVEERELIAEAYDKRVISVTVATCSLAAGINLPARRVILYGFMIGRDTLGPVMLSVSLKKGLKAIAK